MPVRGKRWSLTLPTCSPKGGGRQFRCHSFLDKSAGRNTARCLLGEKASARSRIGPPLLFAVASKRLSGERLLGAGEVQGWLPHPFHHQARAKPFPEGWLCDCLPGSVDRGPGLRRFGAAGVSKARVRPRKLERLLIRPRKLFLGQVVVGPPRRHRASKASGRNRCTRRWCRRNDRVELLGP